MTFTIYSFTICPVSSFVTSGFYFRGRNKRISWNKLHHTNKNFINKSYSPPDSNQDWEVLGEVGN